MSLLLCNPACRSYWVFERPLPLPPFICEACNLLKRIHHSWCPLGQKPGPQSAPSNRRWHHYPLRHRSFSDLSSFIFCGLILSEDHCRLKTWRGMILPHRCPRSSGRGVHTIENLPSTTKQDHMHIHIYLYARLYSLSFQMLQYARNASNRVLPTT